MVSIAYADLSAVGLKVTVKSVQDYIFDKTGVKASPNLITDELRSIRNGDGKEVASNNAVQGDRPFTLVTSARLVEGEVSDDQSELDREQPDYRAKYQELEVQYRAAKEILELYKREIAALRDTVKRQSESLARLNTYFAEQIREMAKEASASMMQTVQELHMQISEMQVARESDQEQWKGLRAFLMSETDRIRETETAKTQMLNRKIADLEMMVTHLTQLKNQAQDEASRLRMQIGER